MRTRIALASTALALAAPALLAQRAYVFAGGCGSGLATNELYEIELGTGEVVASLGGRAECDFEGLEVVDGRLLASTEVSAARPGLLYDITEAPGVPLGPAVARSGVDHEMAVDPTTGTLYALNGAESGSVLHTWLYRIDPATGSPTLVGESGFYADSLAIDADGVGYAVDMIFRQSLYRVDLETGALSLVGPIAIDPCCPAALNQTALGFDAAGRLWFIVSGTVALPTRIYTLDPATGEATFVADMERLTSGAGSLIDAVAIVPPPACEADLDGDGELTVFDFLVFGNLFDLGDPRADFDGDGAFTIFDFLAFQTAFDAGCP